MTSVLPISLDTGIHLDGAKALAIGEELAGDYCFAEPYPHIVLDNFLPVELAQRMLDDFPQEALEHDRKFDAGYEGKLKRQIFPNDCAAFPRQAFNFFNSAPFLQFLEGLTTIQGLIADPYFDGGGYHETRTGGLLGVHADFRINARLKLLRRLNVIIYLNPAWQDEWNGHLEIWDRKMTACARKIAPLFNRCVVFNTDLDTFHGHPDPLQTPPEVRRRSIALYYYTASEAVYEDSPDRSTLYVPRPGDDRAVQLEAMKLKRNELLKDYVPPILWRVSNRAARVMRRMTNGSKK